MPTSTYFNHFTNASEQKLVEDLIVEAIKHYGHDCFYCPRTATNPDAVWKESEYDVFSSAYMLEFYVKTTAQFAGEGAMLSKFGVEIRDQLVLTVAMRTFADEVSSVEADIVRPREGDIIYIPMTGHAYRIDFVDRTSFFYQLGALQAWDLSLELYEQDTSVFDTGIPAIDALYQPVSEDVLVQSLKTESGDLLIDERSWYLILEKLGDPLDQDQNVELEDDADELIDWSEDDPFSDGARY